MIQHIRCTQASKLRLYNKVATNYYIIIDSFAVVFLSNHLSIKCQKIVKNVSRFPRVQSDVLKCLVLSDHQSKSQRDSV